MKINEKPMQTSGSSGYVALISHRVYKKLFPHTKAVTIILEGKGSHLDPDLVDAFMAILEEF
jgi:putative two-component system response regulator